ncbi:unnamed protein product, partial [Brassica rapa]
VLNTFKSKGTLQRRETHESEPCLLLRKKRDFHRKMKEREREARSTTRLAKVSLTFENGVEFDFLRLASCSPDDPKGEKKSSFSFSLCSRQM